MEVELILAGVCTVFFALMLWLVYEAITAPLVDENENVIDDPWGRMGP